MQAMARLGQRRSKKSHQDVSKSNDSILEEKSEASENAHLSPKEAFHRFDTNSSGDIDEDEFFHLLQSVGIKGSEEYQERLFKRYVKSGSKTIDYDGFKAAWLLLGNPKQELIDRGINNLPKFATRFQLVRLLEKILDEEERLDVLAKAEEDRYRRVHDSTNLRTEYIQRAKARAGLELGDALDAAGQVYILGTGAHAQFDGAPKKDMSTSSFHPEGVELLQSLWEERVQSESCGANSNTAGIWGRRPRKVVLTDNTILALTDSGILSWGGTSNWHNLSDGQPTPHTSRQLAQTTPRSSTLLMNNEFMHQKHLTIIQEEVNEKEVMAASELETLQIALKYYGQWPFHFDGTNDLGMVQDHLLTNVSHDQLLHSLLLRGKPCEGKGLSKLAMADMLANDICLEKEMLGEGGQQELRDMECEIVDLKERNKSKSANSIRLKFAARWTPLLAQAKQRAMAAEKHAEAEIRINRNKQDEEYEQWDAKRLHIENCSVLEKRGLMAGSITARGSDIQTPRGVSQCLDIAAGSNHAALILQDERSRGSLYTWGVSSLGRLGQGNGQDILEDINYPNVVGELKGVSIVNMSMGQAHSAAVSSKGSLFLWGAGSSGQLGFGEMPKGEGYYCPIPTKSLLTPPCKVIKVSCGACHTACIGILGELYVWGLGDGGRLGLGPGRMATQHTPTLVDSLRHEKIFDVSCGTSTTLVLTRMQKVDVNSRTTVKRKSGGRLYIAGPKSVLGTSFPSFGELECLKQNPMIIKSIGAGYSHQSFVSDSGELYCWGRNLYGCCGQEERTRFISEPTKVEWIYKSPQNLALGKPCQLSSHYKDSEGLSACNAVDGNIDGNRTNLAHTQFEACPYLDVDLGSFMQISNVRLWNRTDEPDDCALQIDMYSKRLFPCFIMISQHPFPNDGLEGREALDACLNQCVAKVRLFQDKRMSNWDVPKYTFGRYIRVQLEETNFLHLAQIEVFGYNKRSHGPIASCSAGKFVTAAVVDGIEDRSGIATAYKRAISADWHNAEILRQFRSYRDAYHEEGNSLDNKAKCLLCVGNEKCEICSLKLKFRGELRDVLNNSEPCRLDDLATHLLSASNIEKHSAVKISEEDTGSDGTKTKSILPVLFKMKYRHSPLRHKIV